MNIISYSDLHLEFYNESQKFSISEKTREEADVLILAGDICTFNDFDRLRPIFDDFKKPIIYVSGNHEYYGTAPITEANACFKEWINELYPHVNFLQNEEFSHDGVHFFGGTMWTDFNENNPDDMRIAHNKMNDYLRIRVKDQICLTPMGTTLMHQVFVSNLLKWFEKDLKGPRVVVSHHCPLEPHYGEFRGEGLHPAYHSLDMIPIIEKYQPDLWVYGHTHFVDDRKLGKTRIISNPAGYKNYREVYGFDPSGKIHYVANV